MMTRNQKYLQTTLFDPFERGSIILFPNILDQGAFAGMHNAPQGRRSLPAHGKIFLNVQERV